MKKRTKFLSNSFAVLLVLMALSIMPAGAAIDGTLFHPSGTPGLTSPGGMVKLGADFWVSDHLLGFCRLDPQPTGLFTINQGTCLLGDGVATGPLSAGQPSTDGTNVYVPDNSNKGLGVWRLTFNSAARTVGSPVLLDHTGFPTAANPTATALDSLGNLYLGFIQDSTIMKISNPNVGIGTVNLTFGATSTTVAKPKVGISRLAIANGPTGQALYLAEKADIARISLSTGGTAVPVSAVLTTAAPAPTAIASDSANTLFISNTPGAAGGPSTILRYSILAGTVVTLATTGDTPQGTTLIESASGLLFNLGTLYIADDPGLALGGQILKGRIFKIDAAATVVAPVVGTLFSAGGVPGITSPGGVIWLPKPLGGHLWVADHGLGFCRVNKDAATGLFIIDQATCIKGANKKVNGVPVGPFGPVSPGQPSFDPVLNNVYVPDNAGVIADADLTGVWNLTFDPATETIATPTIATNLLINMTKLNKNRPGFTAVDNDGNLYIGFVSDNPIMKFTVRPVAPAVPTLISNFGVTAGAVNAGIFGLTVANELASPAGKQALYLAEGTQVTRIDLGAVVLPVQAVPVPGLTGLVPTAITSLNTLNTADRLFIANTPGGKVANSPSAILQFDITAQTLINPPASPFSSLGTFPDGTTTTYKVVTALALLPIPPATLPNHVFIADDPTAAAPGALTQQGHIWNTVLDTQAPSVIANPTVSSPGFTAARSGTTVTLNATVFDATTDPFLSAVSGVKNVTVDGTPLNASLGRFNLTNVPGTNFWMNSSVPVFAPDGIFLLPVIAFDNADIPSGGTVPPNVNNTIRLTVIVDNTPPVFGLTVPGTLEAAFNSAVISAPVNDGLIGSGVKMVTADLSSIGQTFTATLTGAQEVPPTGSTATGTGLFVIDTVNNTLAFNIEFAGLLGTETGAHIHGPAAAGVNAGILFPLPPGSPKVGVWNYDQAMEASILAGQTYVNIHSTRNLNGEIRGQILPVPLNTINMALVGASWQATIVSPKKGVFTLPLNATDNAGNSNPTGTVGLTATDTRPPEINSTKVVPAAIIPFTETTTLMVDTKDFGNVSPVTSVTVNLASIGGGAAVPLQNIGGTIWNVSNIGVAAGFPILNGSLVSLPVTSTDAVGNPNASASIPLGIKSVIPITPGVRTPFNFTINARLFNGNITTPAGTTGNLILSPTGLPANPALQGLKFAGVTVDLAGLTFTGLVKIEMEYDLIALADPANETKLRLWSFDTVSGKWVIADGAGAPDTVNKTVSGNTTHFSVFAPLADVTPPVISSILPATGSTVQGASATTVSWVTDELSSSRVIFGTSAANVSSNIGDARNATVAGNVTSHSVTISGLPFNTPIFFTVSSTDLTGNSATSALINFTLVPVPSVPSSGGGGGGGGGVTSAENFTNVEKRETREDFLRKDVAVSYKIVTPEIPVKEMVITANLNAGNVAVQVELLKDKSKLVTKAPAGMVYKYVNMWVGTSGFGTSKNIKEGVVKFRVPNSWLDSNKVASADIKLLRWDGNDWMPLETAEKMKDDTYTYFEAKTNNFSPFVIASMKPIPSAEGPTVTKTTPKPPETPGRTTGAPKETEAPKGKVPGFEAIIAIVTLSALYLLRKRR